MLRARVIVVVSIAVAALLAGCGSSSSSSSSSAASAPPASTSAQRAYGVASSAPAASSAPVALVVSKPNKLGTVLGAGPKRLTVYLFEADKGSTSSCSGACAAVWPPVTTTGQPKAVAGALTADLSTIKRPDGSVQVTYKGHPLYYYAKDGDAKDAYGQGLKQFGAGWYVLAPSGHKIDQS